MRLLPLLRMEVCLLQSAPCQVSLDEGRVVHDGMTESVHGLLLLLQFNVCLLLLLFSIGADPVLSSPW